MAPKTATQQARTENRLQKKAPSPHGDENKDKASTLAVPPAVATRSNESSGMSSPLRIAAVKQSNLEKFNSITRRDKRHHLDVPPPLPIDLRRHKFSISVFTFLALAECCFVPIGFYYGLSKGTNMRSGKLSLWWG